MTIISIIGLLWLTFDIFCVDRRKKYYVAKHLK